MHKRKPIHIAVNAEGDPVVICDDGSLWHQAQGAWDLLAEIDDFNPPPAADEDEKVLRFIVDCLREGQRYTKEEIEKQSDRMRLSRKQVRAAFIRLRLNKRILEEELPAPEKRGIRRTYMKPVLPPPPVSDNRLHCHTDKVG
ncbi:MAG: hypothetical protein ACR65R_21075 [Methylomicrobium sp.]